MMRMSRSTAAYEKLSPVSRVSYKSGYSDLQFSSGTDPAGKKFPVKAVVLACVLFAVGTALLVIGSLLVCGIIPVDYADRTWPVIILGALTFIPGAYNVRIAWYAYRGVRGYSYDDIPSLD